MFTKLHALEKALPLFKLEFRGQLFLQNFEKDKKKHIEVLEALESWKF